LTSIASIALRYRAVVLILSGVLLVAGLWSWMTLAKEAYPDVGDTQVTVITTFAGRAAREVEQQVTIPIERVLNSIPRVIARRSKTIFGLSVIQITFEEGVDDYFARMRVTERLSEADLPADVHPSLAPLTGPVGEIFRYVIEADENFTPMELRTLQDWVIIPRLLQVTGVADVINFGGLVKQFHVVTSPEKLARYGLTMSSLIDAIQENNVNTGGNIVPRGEQGFAVRAMGAIQSIKHLESIVVTSQKGVPVTIHDLAIVQEFPRRPSGILGYWMKEDDGTVRDVASGVQGLVAMLRGQDPATVVDGLKDRVKEINERWLPKGVKLRITYDRSELVHYTLRTVTHTLIEGICIVLFVLVIFLGSFRAATVVAITIPLSLMFSFMLMRIFDIRANLLSLGAIDFGIIVDGAVVMVENLMRHYRESRPAQDLKSILLHTIVGAAEVTKEIVFSITIIILAYLPIFTMERVEGRLFRPMAYTLSFAIAGSLLLSLTLIPVLMTYIYKDVAAAPTKGFALHANTWFDRLRAWYDKLVGRLLDNGKRVLQWTAIGVTAVIIGGYFFIGSEFLPELDEGSFNIRTFFPVEITLRQTQKYAPIIRETIGKYSPVKLVVTQAGRNDDGTDPYGPNRMEILVALKDYNDWSSLISKRELLTRIKADLEAAVPGALFAFSQPILDNVTEAVTGSVAHLAVLLNGEDTDVMREVGKKILELVRSTRGSSESGIEQEPNQAQLVVHVNRPNAARYGINVADIQKMIEAAIGGGSISKLFDGEKRFDIVVRYSADYRSSLDSIGKLQIPTVGGARIPLSQLAEIKIEDGPTIIQRLDGRRQISVRTNVRGRDQGSFVKEAQAKVSKNIKVPEGYDIVWGGQFENLTRASQRLAIVIPITILIICGLLGLLYRDAFNVFVAMSCIPLSLVGGILALWMRGYNFSVSAGVGFISLFGIATMSGVLYISRARHLKHSEPDATLRELTLKTASIQLRPVLMTMVLALLGLVPAALAEGIGSDVQRRLATVVVGGLISSLVLTLTVLPVLYYFVEARRKVAAVDQ
jgi:cobalt-zinc-cadmium resistance protein CzcA